MNETLFAFVRAAILAFFSIITYYVVPLIKRKLKDQNNTELMNIIDIVIHSIEQQDDYFKKMGLDKKTVAMETIKKWAGTNKLPFHDYQIDSIIEALVYEMNKNKPPKEEEVVSINGFSSVSDGETD